jgi:hypothetical protein
VLGGIKSSLNVLVDPLTFITPLSMEPSSAENARMFGDNNVISGGDFTIAENVYEKCQLYDAVSWNLKAVRYKGVSFHGILNIMRPVYRFGVQQCGWWNIKSAQCACRPTCYHPAFYGTLVDRQCTHVR